MQGLHRVPGGMVDLIIEVREVECCFVVLVGGPGSAEQVFGRKKGVEGVG